MKRKWKIALFCIASIVLNLLTTYLVFDVCHIPLFFDTIFTVAIVFYLGLIPGLIVGILFNVTDTLFNFFVRGVYSPTNICFALCGAAIVLVTWAFARKKEEFQISVPITILYLLLIALLSSCASIFIGGFIVKFGELFIALAKVLSYFAVPLTIAGVIFFGPKLIHWLLN